MSKGINRIKVEHETIYSYEHDVRYAIQRIYLSPRFTQNTRVIDWQVKANFDMTTQIDSLGNKMHLLVVSKPSKSICISVNGVVEVSSKLERTGRKKNLSFEKEKATL